MTAEVKDFFKSMQCACTERLALSDLLSITGATEKLSASLPHLLVFELCRI